MMTARLYTSGVSRFPARRDSDELRRILVPPGENEAEVALPQDSAPPKEDEEAPEEEPPEEEPPPPPEPLRRYQNIQRSRSSGGAPEVPPRTSSTRGRPQSRRQGSRGRAAHASSSVSRLNQRLLGPGSPAARPGRRAPRTMCAALVRASAATCSTRAESLECALVRPVEGPAAPAPPAAAPPAAPRLWLPLRLPPLCYRRPPASPRPHFCPPRSVPSRTSP